MVIDQAQYISCTAVKQKVLLNTVAHFEHVQVIRCDLKPGSIKRSI
jgi:hypothetical protein